MRIPSFTRPHSSATAAPAPTTDLPLPPLHTSALAPGQKVYLAQSPTYTAQLRALENLHSQVRGLKAALRLREVGAWPGLDHGSRPLQCHVQQPTQECERLERELWRWDGELAGLAEALLARPGFGVGEEVVWRDDGGGWWWRIPEG